jgi:hypothetical protein
VSGQGHIAPAAVTHEQTRQAHYTTARGDSVRKGPTRVPPPHEAIQKGAADALTARTGAAVLMGVSREPSQTNALPS